MKTCKKCGFTCDDDDIPKNFERVKSEKYRLGGYFRGQCKKCCRAIRKAWKDKHPERVQAYKEKPMSNKSSRPALTTRKCRGAVMKDGKRVAHGIRLPKGYQQRCPACVREERPVL